MRDVRRLFRRMYRRTRWRARMASAGRRTLPNFIVIGAQKGGTTPLNHYLMRQHPNVLRPSKKEVHFYDRNFDKGVRWYRAHFPLTWRIGKNDTCGEASPYYMAHPLVAGRIASLQPDVKLIAVLRNPRDRAISHYYMSYRKGRDSRSIEDAIINEHPRLEAEYERLRTDPSYDSEIYRYFSYKHRGRYAEQLSRYFSVFDRHQVLVIPSEALRDRTADTLDRMCAFLDIPAMPQSVDLRPWKVRPYPREIPETLETHLREYFAPLNRELYELLGQDFGW